MLSAVSAAAQRALLSVYSSAEVDAAVATKASLASPTFTGTPAAPTAAGGTNTTQVATTAFVTVQTLSSAAGGGNENIVAPMPTSRNTVDYNYINGATLIGAGSAQRIGYSGPYTAVGFGGGAPALLTTHYQRDNSTTSVNGQGYDQNVASFGPSIFGGGNCMVNAPASCTIGNFNGLIRWNNIGHNTIVGGDACLIAGSLAGRCTMITPTASVQYDSTHAGLFGGYNISQQLCNNSSVLEGGDVVEYNVDNSVAFGASLTLTDCNKTIVGGSTVTATNVTNGLIVAESSTIAAAGAAAMTNVFAVGSSMTIAHSPVMAFGTQAMSLDTAGLPQRIFSSGALHVNNYSQIVEVDGVKRVAGNVQTSFGLLLDRTADRKIYGTVEVMLTGMDRTTATLVGSCFARFKISIVNDADGGTDGVCRIWNDSATSATVLNIAADANGTLGLTGTMDIYINQSYLRLLTPIRVSSGSIEWHMSAKMSLANCQS